MYLVIEFKKISNYRSLVEFGEICGGGVASVWIVTSGRPESVLAEKMIDGDVERLAEDEFRERVCSIGLDGELLGFSSCGFPACCGFPFVSNFFEFIHWCVKMLLLLLAFDIFFLFLQKKNNKRNYSNECDFMFIVSLLS